MNTIKKIYAQIPFINCKGKCHNACTLIEMSDYEKSMIVERVGYDPFITPEKVEEKIKAKTLTHDCLSCPLLKNKRCSIYDIRPLICRLFGVAKGLRCPYGCKPKKWLSDVRAKNLIKKAMELKT